MAELVDLDDAKVFVGFNAQMDSEALMEAAHAAGNQLALNWLGWDPNQQTVTEVRNGLGGPSLPLGRAAIKSVSSVKIDGASVPIDGFGWSGRMLYYRRGIIPRGLYNVEVTYVSGYRPLPDDMVHGARLAVKAVWMAMGLDPNFASHQVNGVEGGYFNPDGPGSLPPGAKVLMQPYRRIYES